MNTDVIIKANSHGIRIILNENHSMEQILADIRGKLYCKEAFLKKNGEVHVTFEGKRLSQEEMDRLLYELNHLRENGAHFVADAVSENEDLCQKIDIPPHKAKTRGDRREEAPPRKTPTHPKKKETKRAAKEDGASALAAEMETPVFFRGNLRRGQSLEVKKSIIIIGNIDRHAQVVSDGNIIVIGALKGTAIAGKDRKKNRFVLALMMEPVHINIGSAVFHRDRKNRSLFSAKDTVMAVCENGQLVFHLLSQTSQSDKL